MEILKNSKTGKVPRIRRIARIAASLFLLSFFLLFLAGLDRPSRGCNAFRFLTSDSNDCYSCLIEDARIYNAQGEYAKAKALLDLVPSDYPGRQVVFETTVLGQAGFSILNIGSMLDAFENTNIGATSFFNVLSGSDLQNTSMDDLQNILSESTDLNTKTVAAMVIVSKIATQCDENNNADDLSLSEWSACSGDSSGGSGTNAEATIEAISAGCGALTGNDAMDDMCSELCTDLGDPSCADLNSNRASSILIAD